jgi:UDP-2-acetamido-3-amino-2,3-dideoxy-glucuronate N-acetyltransferase
MNKYFVHKDGNCESVYIGDNTRIWAFTHILPGARIGFDCNICDHTFIENDVIIGNRVTVKCGVQLWDGLRVEDDVFIGPNVTFANDIFPRSKVHSKENLITKILKGASLGANSTILPGITIGENAMIGAGAVVTKSVPPNAIVVGNPARITGYINSEKAKIHKDIFQAVPNDSLDIKVKGVIFKNFPKVKDIRGSLSVGEFEKDIPFIPKRYFLVFDVPSFETRGEHAHKTCEQFLICLHGSCNVVLEDGENRQEFLLDTATKGIYIPPLIWGIQYKYSKDTVLLVFASEYYDSSDYIRDYQEWKTVIFR